MEEEPITFEEQPPIFPPVPMVTFDDVLVVPNYSEIESRAYISTEVDFLGLPLKIPVIAANMDYIAGHRMVKTMHENGAMAILHRFAEWDELASEMDVLDKENIPFFFSVGIRDIDESMSRIESVPENCVGVCIDVAHGHHSKVAKLITLTKERTDLRVIAGNVATGTGAKFLADAGADAIKVGIGAGSVCTTRLVAGVGMPQLSAIMDAAEAVDIPIIADGGIRGSADVLKAFIAGASIVMAGMLFAGTTECPVPTVIGSDGHKYRPFRGQSIFGVNGERYVKEGVEGYVEDKGPVKDVLDILQAGLRSGMSYIGAENISQIKDKGQFVLISAHSHMENQPRVRQVI